MSKKIQGEDGKTYVEKKPFYKHVWFWIVVAVVVIAAAGGLNGSDDDASNSTATSSKTEKKEPAKKVKTKVTKPSVPAEYIAALRSADTYANDMHMSKAGLYDQLTSSSGDKFPAKAAQYAIDHVKTDWNKNALESAKTYQKDMDMSTAEIKDQLSSDAGDQFTTEQAQYAIDHLDK
ncbi:MAG: hypothetical protein HDR41_04320 [Lactobacillus sp.]|nr:hypothetical protein [Lactobacillus sp.]